MGINDPNHSIQDFTHLHEKQDDFCHLHVHTEYSLLDGQSKIKELVDEASRLGQRAVGISDHGGVSGAYALWSECRTRDVPLKPIIGCEFYVAPDGMDRKEPVFWGDIDTKVREDVGNQGAATHLTVIAESAAGLRNLFRLHALSYSRGFYRKPRIDVATLESHKVGLVVLSGCLGSELQTRIKLGQRREAEVYAATMRDIFGDAFYIEVMSHGIPIEEKVNQDLLTVAERLHIPMVATNDSHYTKPQDQYAHDAMLCLQTYAKLTDKERFRFDGSGYHLRSLSEMRQLPLPADSLSRTLEIAERVGSYDEIFEHNLRLPGTELNLRDEVLSAISDRGDHWWTTEYQQRLLHEMNTIESVGAAGYILNEAAILKKWRESGIRVGPGRGSSAGSLVCYALSIVDVDPIQEGLLFERFMDPSRMGLPDIDTDIQDSRRDEAIQIVEDIYGTNRVARVGTNGTMTAKAAIKDSARVLGWSWREAEELTGWLPPAKFGRSPKLSEFEGDKNLDAYKLAVQLEDTIRTRGVHAAGVIVSPVDLLDQLPLWKEPPTKKDGCPQWITAFTNKDVFPVLEKMGLNKYDFLGLKALDVIDKTLEMHTTRVRGSLLHEGEPTERVFTTGLSWDDLPRSSREADNQAVYDLLSSGNTLGVFQLDSPGMQQLLRGVKPSRFAQISAVLALYRPGPMGVNAHHSYAKRASGRERISYPHPEFQQALAPILEETYGLIVYQEQVLQTLTAVGGYDMTSAAAIFYSMRKKLKEKMNESYPDFEERLLVRGYSGDAVGALWSTLVPFADYSFNRSHCVVYGLISYWMAYLKAHYPVEFMCALLSRTEDPDDLRKYLDETQRMGIPILPPDINESESGWTPTAEGIRYGISSIHGVGEKAFTAVTAKRPYNSLDDFLGRAPKKALQENTVYALVASGAFDKLCPYREELLLDAKDLVGRAIADRDEKAKGASLLIRSVYDVAPRGLYNGDQRKALEAEYLGVQLTQLEVRGRVSRALDVDEIEYLHTVCASNPGDQPLKISFGDFTVQLGKVSLTNRLKLSFEALGVSVDEY